MGDFPRAQFLPQKPPCLSSRQRRESPIHIVPTRPVSRPRKWVEAFVIVFLVVAFIGLLVALVLLGVLPGEFIKR